MRENIFLGTATGSAAPRSGLGRPNKGTDELASHLSRQFIDIRTPIRQKGSRIIGIVNSCGLDIDIGETGFGELL
jgi:hypothetical protein